MIFLNDDTPIKTKENDFLDRSNFAENIAKLIQEREEDNCLVIGLHGAWGEGKTSIINMVKEELINNKTDKLIIMDFNPWRYDEEDALLALFYKDLAKHCGKKLNKEFKKVVKKYVPSINILSKLFGLEILGKAISSLYNFIPNYELIDFKVKAQKIISDEEKKIVVFIDDIDRLEKKEIERVFKLVKLNLDMSNVYYIVSFDKTIVTEAIYEDIKKGEDYLDKIIQVQLDIPPVRGNDLMNFFFNEINNIFDEVSDHNLNIFMTKYNNMFNASLTNPRQLKRIINVIRFSYFQLKGEINVFDLITIESTKVLYPRLHKKIKEDNSMFFEVSSMDKIFNIDKENEKDKEEFNNFLNEFKSKVEKEAIIEIIKYLFSNMNYLTSDGGNRSANKFLDSEKRLASLNYFDRYFSYSVYKEDISDLEIESLVKDLSKHNDNNFQNFYLNLVNARKQKKFFEKLTSKINIFNDHQLDLLIDNLLSLESYLTFKGTYETNTMYYNGNLITMLILNKAKLFFDQKLNNILNLDNFYYKSLLFSYLFEKGSNNFYQLENELGEEYLKSKIELSYRNLSESLEKLDSSKVDYRITDALYLLSKVDRGLFDELVNTKVSRSKEFIMSLINDFNFIEEKNEGVGDRKNIYNDISYYADMNLMYEVINGNFKEDEMTDNLKGFMRIHERIKDEINGGNQC